MKLKEQKDNLIEYIKSQDIRGCITGSIYLDYFENQDIDVFVYDEQHFMKLYYAMYYNPMFQILDKTELWKANKFMDSPKKYNKIGIDTIKFYYNTCVEVNIIYKKGCNNIYGVLETFDLDILCKGHDIMSSKFLDLSENLPNNKATYNKLNPAFRKNQNVWEISRVLRQLSRCFKYYKRGYNTDEIVLKYIEMIDDLKKHENLFKSDKVESLLKIMNNNYDIVKKICLEWLKTHEITDEQIELLNEKVRKI